MALNIESPVADSLAREVAALTGESLTRAVIASLEERLGQLRARTGRTAASARLQRLADEYAELAVVDPRPADEVLGYDVDGFPA